MSYQVIARKWRPQKFDEVVGQQAVTRTLRNALASQRLAQAFVFAGPRGVGKTTTARILARALNCVNGPTPDPCGICDACVEIAEGRDIDVLEIDAATHTGIDNVREVIISGLSIRPARDRYKIFIIDEVHQLSTPSFNALLKSIEEPPPHVVFMMATTELEKIPETVLSRSQVYEFRTISSKAIAAQLRLIVDAECIQIGDESLQLIARDAEGSMRDAQTKLDQVIAFTGNTISSEDVATVLGLVGRDLLLDAVEAVANEDASAAFRITAQAVELGYDLRAVCRELSRLVRDLLVILIDPSRLMDPEIAGESERDRLKTLAAQFSREDLLRAFDLLTKADADIRGASQPRHHLEMAFLRWIYLRKLLPIEDLIAGSSSGERPVPAPRSTPAAPAAKPISPSAIRSAGPPAAPVRSSEASLKDALLAEIRKSKVVFYNTVVAQAQRIDVADDRVTFTFLPTHRALREQFDQTRAWLESTAERVAGHRVAVTAVQSPAIEAAQPAAPAPAKSEAPKRDLKAEALSSSAVQAMLDVFPAEIRDVEEM
jgi:DNA polymerase III subunit gamma/tau